MRMLNILVVGCVALLLLNAGCTRKTRLGGAGATFPATLYQQWCKDFTQAKGISLNYTASGSGDGEQKIIQGTVDFAGSDAPNPKTLEEKIDSKGLVFLPMTAGAIVLTYNLEGVDKLKLSQKAVVGIYLGTITKWADNEIVKDNPDLKEQLTNAKDIVAVSRDDSSGTSEIFTGFLSSASEDFKKQIGKSKAPNFPKCIKAKGNEGITSQIKQKSSSIGYIEFGYAKSSNRPMVWLQNKEGKFIEPTLASGQAALASIELPENLVAFEFNPKGERSYPIVTYTWLMVYKKYDDPKKADAIKEFVRYGVHEGQKKAEILGYLPLPEAVVARVEKALDQVGH